MARAFGITLSLIWLLVAVPQRAVATEDWVVRPVRFKSADGAVLAGSVVTPRNHAATAAVVLVHGSGAAKRYTALAQLMALSGVAALTYDKRGVGVSAGRYEAEDDVSAAPLENRKLCHQTVLARGQ